MLLPNETGYDLNGPAFVVRSLADPAISGCCSPEVAILPGSLRGSQSTSLSPGQLPVNRTPVVDPT